MSSHTGPEHEHDPEHNPTSQDPKSGIAGAASTAAGKTFSFMTAKLPTKTSRIVAVAAAGTMVLAGAGTAYAVHSNDVSNHNKQVAAAQFAAEQKAAADKAAADAAAQAAAEKAAADKAAADKAAADKAAADAAAKAAADKAAADAAAKAAAQKAAADKAAADQRAAAAAAANRDEQRQPLPSSTPTQTSTPTPTPTPTPKPTTPTGSYGSAQAIAQSMVPSGQFECFSNIIERESGWNVHASNPSSGAYGLGQALPGSKMASAGSDWEDNPTTQIKWVLSYMDSRYGSPCGAWSFWQSHSWY
ncbi:hypothetical protein KGQ20_11590 [Catenulispora sp. NF23]|uniref:Transglycosylase SLT domain-containing protein n=1 Tax=Catenulispora pinistramenti TaxID=2705254 RepID=A0ABS5KKP1_9ACTN|nr:hypothetical protein [Catenulispora pinistramenti]MBS2533414.1 hypothetical protein [Catenulispora pinistramenti]MBS2546612.1 hypothetical protein [Catenulispora pinistramenti]